MDVDVQPLEMLSTAVHHRNLRTKSAIRRYQTGAYRIITKEVGGGVGGGGGGEDKDKRKEKEN